MSRRAERQARRAARRAQRQANKETRQQFRKDKLAARSDRQKQRQGFLAGLAPQILDKLPAGGTNWTPTTPEPTIPSKATPTLDQAVEVEDCPGWLPVA